MSVQRASYSTRDTWLGKEFGEKLARKYFGDELIDSLPRNTKGKSEGKLKATIEWIKVEEGGWVYNEQRVERRVGKIVAARLINRPFRGPVEVIAQWGESGRFQQA